MKSPRLFFILSMLLVLTSATAFAVTRTVGATGADFTSVQAAINASAATDAISLLAGNTFTENVIVDRILTITGVDTTAKINGSITINSNSVTLGTFVVYGSAGAGISAAGRSTLTFNSVVSRNNVGSGLSLTTCTTVTINGGSYSKNLDEGINAVGGSTYTMTGVRADSNGTGADGSGINAKGMSTVTLTDLTANGNHHHGLSVGDGAAGVTMSGGTFTGNGTAGDAATGGGINFIAMGTSTTSAITLDGVVNSSNNTTAGIYIYSDNASTSITTVAIGGTGSITLSNNGSANETYSGGAGVLIYGIVSGVSIANTAFTKGAAPGAGLLNLGDGTPAGSPSGTSVSGCTFSGYTSARPAVSLTDNATPTPHTSPNDVTATGNTFIFPVAVKVFLQGPYSGGTMGTALRVLGDFPLIQPYAGYGGSETVVSVPANVVDWVQIDLRSTFNGAAVSQRAAFLLNDGTVVDIDGTAKTSFTEVLATGYTISNFIVVRHRNHLAVMSAAAVSLPNEAAVYDFTTAQTQAYGTNPMRSLSGAFGMYAGDANGNGSVVYNGASADRVTVLQKVGLATASNVVSGYFGSDVNMDGNTVYNGAASDRVVILTVVGLATASNVVSTQIP